MTHSKTLLLVVLLLGFCTIAFAGSCPQPTWRTVTFTDPTAADGDPISTAGDVIAIQLAIDPATGDYEVAWTADAANPFDGDLKLVLNLGRGGVNLYSMHKDFYDVDGAETLSYSGRIPHLTTLQIGDDLETYGDLSPRKFGSALIDMDNIAVQNRDIIREGGTLKASVTVQMSTLRAAVTDLGLSRGLERSLLAKLDGASDKIADGKCNAAAGKLRAFVNEVEAQSGKAIDEDDADMLVDVAEALIDCL